MQADFDTLLEKHAEMVALPVECTDRVKHFKKFVIQLLEDVKAECDGTLPELMRVASKYPNDVLEMACGKWRATVIRDGQIPEEVMAQLSKMVEMQKLTETNAWPEDERCGRECAQIIMGMLDSIPDSNSFQEVLEVFPPAAVYATLATHRVQFTNRFGSIIERQAVNKIVASVSDPDKKKNTRSWLLSRLNRMHRVIQKNGSSHTLEHCIRKMVGVRKPMRKQ